MSGTPRPLRVLIVEDRPTDAELVVRELRHAGFAPDWQRVDTEAGLAASLRPDLDVILSDYQMPGFSGLRALEVLQESGLDIPLIIVSGTIGEDTAVAAMKQGASDYLLKDRLTRLGPAVNQAMERARLRKERKQAEEGLRESERRFREMLENVELMAMTLDKNGRVTFCNDYLLRMTGRKREEVIGAEWFGTFVPGNQELKPLFFTSIEAGEIPPHHTNAIQTREGELREVVWSNTMLRDIAGNIVGTASLGEDVTERARADASLREKEEAERANRAKSEFLSRMSHELRTPMHAILGFAQLLEMDERSPADAESIAQIVRAGNHLLGLINEVLDLASVESGKLALTSEPVRVRRTLEETLSFVKPQAARRHVRLEPLTGDLDCEVLSSAQHFKQVILNLLSNAVKFDREGGAVTVSCEKLDDYLRIKVADTGPGISAENMPKLFVPFERLHAGDTVIEGAGLGLSLSKHLVEAMGGKIGVESTPGKGTTFWVELPLVQGTPAATARSLAAPISGVAEVARSTTPRTLLYIEDNLSNLRLVERILARRPEVKLISAMQGSIGLELARQHLPDLVLLDLHLPDIQGDEILLQLRADPTTAQLPIVMISADATSAQIERLRAAGASDYLTKPIDVRKFLAVVDAIEPGKAPAAALIPP